MLPIDVLMLNASLISVFVLSGLALNFEIKFFLCVSIRLYLVKGVS